MTPADTLMAALLALRTDRPADYLAILAEMSGLTVSCDVDTQTFGVTCKADAITLTHPRLADLHLRMSRAMLIALVDGDQTLMSAIKSRHLHLIGPTAALARLARAQRMFADGAARSRRVQRVFDTFRTPG
jgi:hypothetical protein